MSLNPQLLGLIPGIPGGPELIVIAVIGLLLFGKRLPEVGKSLGRSIVEFKKGLRGIEDEVDKAVEGEDQADMLPPPDKSDSQENKTEQQTVAQAGTGESRS